MIKLLHTRTVISTNCDPIPGWINNIYGLTGVLLASGLGFVRVLPYNEKKLGDFVCADFVINSTLAATWATYERRLVDCIVLFYPLTSTSILNLSLQESIGCLALHRAQ